LKHDSTERGTIRTSSILIAAGRGFSVYRKLDEVPPQLRSKLVKSTAGANAGTVLIADRRGAQELLRENIKAVLDRREASARPGILPQLRQDTRDVCHFVLLHWKGVSLTGLLTLAAWWAIALLRA
jgi:hypothetical protein